MESGDGDDGEGKGEFVDFGADCRIENANFGFIITPTVLKN
jgi:hypothetical protein